MSMHEIETDPALLNASITDRACINAGDACPAFKDAHELSQKLVSYNHQFDYGHYVSWFLVATLGIFVLSFVFQKLTGGSLPGTTKLHSAGPIATLSQKMKAGVRYVSYRRIPGKISDQLGMPSMGIIILGLLFSLYCLLLTFIVRPYYRAHRGYGSPPLGIRTGLMATALTPWIIALSGKANLITMMTGIGHEKLNVIHRWISRICFFLSVVHTVPFIVAPLRDGGYAALHKQFYKHGSLEYSGTPALAILFGIVLLSIRWIRHKFYESFYLVHILLGISYLGLLYWHASNLGDSWIYLWMTVALWLFSYVVRAFWYNRAFNIRQLNWFQGFNSNVSLLAGDVTKIKVYIPEKIPVRPGQHCFLRFPDVSLFDNHPFTLAWTEDNSVEDEKAIGQQRLTFMVRARKGFTAKLAKGVEVDDDKLTSVSLDGPYGGINANLEATYDHAVLVAGGIGITGCLPWLQHFLRSRQAGNAINRLSSVQLVWVVHEAHHVQWADTYLQSLLQSGEGFLEIEIHCTAISGQLDRAETLKEDNSDVEKAATMDDTSRSKIAPSASQVLSGRPSMETVVSSHQGGKVVVIGCGPNSLKVDLSNACAKAQGRVLSGELEELSLHTETFGW